MTSRERLLAAMHCADVDRLPCGPFGLGRLNINSDIAQELIRKTDIFLPVGVKGNHFLGKRAETESVEEGNITKHIIHTPKGSLERKVERTEKTQATVEYPLKDLEDLDKLLSIPYEPPEIDPQAYFDLQENYGQDTLVLVNLPNAVCFPAEWFGPANFSLLWATNPEKIIELTELMNERVCEFVNICCNQGVKDFRIIGGEYVSVHLGPEAMPSLIRGPDRQLIDLIHNRGEVAFYHNHGQMMQFLEDYAYIGVDFLEPMEAPPWGDVDLGEARKIIGDRYCMVGNLDDMEIIEKLDQETVKQTARERIEQAGPRGFVLSGTGSGTYTENGARKFIAMADVAAEYST